jgi:hypothetical protein
VYGEFIPSPSCKNKDPLQILLVATSASRVENWATLAAIFSAYHFIMLVKRRDDNTIEFYLIIFIF